MIKIIKLTFVILVFALIFTTLSVKDTRLNVKCEKHYSEYTCDFIENKATYNVYYWEKYIEHGNPEDDKLIGTVVGLNSCKNMAEYYSGSINEEWHKHAYVCVLTDGTKETERHRPGKSKLLKSKY